MTCSNWFDLWEKIFKQINAQLIKYGDVPVCSEYWAMWSSRNTYWKEGPFMSILVYWWLSVYGHMTSMPIMVESGTPDQWDLWLTTDFFKTVCFPIEKYGEWREKMGRFLFHCFKLNKLYDIWFIRVLRVHQSQSCSVSTNYCTGVLFEHFTCTIHFQTYINTVLMSLHTVFIYVWKWIHL